MVYKILCLHLHWIMIICLQIERLKKQLNREQHEKEHLCVMNAKCAEELELTVSITMVMYLATYACLMY